MHELTDQDLYKAIEYTRNIDEETGRPILDKFHTDQPAFAQMMLSILPTLIAEQDQEMGHLFMDLCFDVTCIYQHAFGNMPTQDEFGPGWIEKH